MKSALQFEIDKRITIIIEKKSSALFPEFKILTPGAVYQQQKSRQILHNGLLHPNCQHSSSSALALPSEKLATINCAKNISKRRRRNTTNGLVILQTLMSPHWTVWEAIIHSFFSGQFQCARPPKYTKKTQPKKILQPFTAYNISYFTLILSAFL